MIPWTVADQAPWSMGFSRQEYWSGVPLPSLRGGNGKVTKGKISEEGLLGRSLSTYLVHLAFSKGEMTLADKFRRPTKCP